MNYEWLNSVLFFFFQNVVDVQLHIKIVLYLLSDSLIDA